MVMGYFCYPSNETEIMLFLNLAYLPAETKPLKKLFKRLNWHHEKVLISHWQKIYDIAVRIIGWSKDSVRLTGYTALVSGVQFYIM